MEIGMPDTSGNRPSVPFLFYDLRDETLPNLRTSQKGPAQGKTRLKVVKVTVTYQGAVTPDVKIEDVGLVVYPISKE
jgi:hypothetical protein